MGEAVDSLLAYSADGSGYDVAHRDVQSLQVKALNERFKKQATRIKLVELRAADAGIDEIRELADIVPLLLPHTAYKSYPESFLSEGKWEKLTRWLGGVSANSTKSIDLTGVSDIDGWVDRLEEAGHFVSCSSGTTGKSAMLTATADDIAFSQRDIIGAYCWGANAEASQDARMFGLAPVAKVPKNTALGEALNSAFASPEKDRFAYPVPPITVGSITGMIVLRKAIAEGRALPEQIAAFEATSADRQKAMSEAVGKSADALIAARSEKLFVSGMWTSLHAIAVEIRGRGYGAKDFNPENLIYVGGGLKGAQLPENYREFVLETFNIAPHHDFQMYGMQEIQTSMPRCQEGGRYHVPPWLVCLPLDKEGDKLLPIDAGEVQGRAAFFDLSMEGRWGGVISGDRIEVDFAPCPCGARSPSIKDNIARYSDLEGDDKIGCAGTVDAYVRGIS